MMTRHSGLHDTSWQYKKSFEINMLCFVSTKYGVLFFKLVCLAAAVMKTQHGTVIVREALEHSPAATQGVRIMEWLRSLEFRRKVTELTSQVLGNIESAAEILTQIYA